jgi:PKD repeat protein
MTTSSEIQLLRSHPQYEQLFLSIYQPTVLFSAVASGSPKQGDRVISYSSGVGTIGNVFANSVLLVGSTAGASDIGRVRIRSADGSAFTVAENWDIPWASGLFLTAINYIDLNPIYPRILNPTGTDTCLFYKDYDIVYTDQNSVLGSIPCAGSHQAVFMGVSGSNAQVYYDATGSVHVKGAILSYEWEFEGGAPATYSGITPGNVEYAVPGHYHTKLTVTGDGATDTTYRFVSVYARNGEVAVPPIQRWSMSQIQGSRSEGGYNVNFKVYDSISSIYDGALVILFADQTTYGSTKQVIGSSPKFVGYIERGTIVYDYQNSCVEFTATSVVGMLKKIEAFSVSCESSTAPDNWYEILDMNVLKAMYHYLKWHTTVLDCTDFRYTGDARVVQFFDSNRQSIYDALNDFVSKGLLGEIVSDRQGRIWVEISAGATQNAPTVLTTDMTLNKQDWMGEPAIEERITKEVSAFELGGVVFDGVSSSIAMLSIAPGFAPATRGKIIRNDGFIGISQQQINEVSGDYYAYLTARYAISLKMAGNYNNIDIAPIKMYLMNLSPSDNVRGLNWVNRTFHPTQIDWAYNSEHGSIYPNVKFNQVTNGLAGGTEAVASTPTGTNVSGSYGIPIDIPPIPPIDIPQIPSIIIPPIPPFTIPPFPGLPASPTYTWGFPFLPTVGFYPGPRVAVPKVIKSIYAYTVGGTSVAFNVELRSDPSVAGLNVTAFDIISTPAYPAGTTTPYMINSTILPGMWFWLHISDVIGAVTQFVVTVETT